jgi:hypothetical protein
MPRLQPHLVRPPHLSDRPRSDRSLSRALSPRHATLISQFPLPVTRSLLQRIWNRNGNRSSNSVVSSPSNIVSPLRTKATGQYLPVARQLVGIAQPPHAIIKSAISCVGPIPLQRRFQYTFVQDSADGLQRLYVNNCNNLRLNGRKSAAVSTGNKLRFVDYSGARGRPRHHQRANAAIGVSSLQCLLGARRIGRSAAISQICAGGEKICSFQAYRP